MDQGREGRGRDARAHGKCTAAADAFLSTQIERGHVRETTTFLPQIIRVLSVIRFALKVEYLIRFLCGPLCISAFPAFYRHFYAEAANIRREPQSNLLPKLTYCEKRR